MKKSVAIIGGGPAALLLAAFLDPDLFDVTIFEKSKSLGRKFLVAGKGGFNLTHSEEIDTFVGRYTPESFLKEAIVGFTNGDLIRWLRTIGIETFKGSSGRIFPIKGIKPIEVLEAIVANLKERQVNFIFNRRWTGWNDKGALIFDIQDPVMADIQVFALGGASWKVTGSDGVWADVFAGRGITTLPFLPANCAYEIKWEKKFLEVNEGRPLKNIAISCDGKTQMGEVVITKFGLEGNAIYALSPQIQKALTNSNQAPIFIDIKPMFSLEKLQEKFTSSGSHKTTEILRKTLRMSSAQINILKENMNKEEFLNHAILVKRIKHLPLTITAAAPLDEAISTTGGIDLDEVTSQYELNKMKSTYCIGEMLNWNAPTGGYLLQASFSMGVHLARCLNEEASTNA